MNYFHIIHTSALKTGIIRDIRDPYDGGVGEGRDAGLGHLSLAAFLQEPLVEELVGFHQEAGPAQGLLQLQADGAVLTVTSPKVYEHPSSLRSYTHT